MNEFYFCELFKPVIQGRWISGVKGNCVLLPKAMKIRFILLLNISEIGLLISSAQAGYKFSLCSAIQDILVDKSQAKVRMETKRLTLLFAIKKCNNAYFACVTFSGSTIFSPLKILGFLWFL